MALCVKISQGWQFCSILLLIYAIICVQRCILLVLCINYLSLYELVTEKNKSVYNILRLYCWWGLANKFLQEQPYQSPVTSSSRQLSVEEFYRCCSPTLQTPTKYTFQIRVASNLTFSNSAGAEFGRISELKFGRSRIWLKLVFWSQNNTPVIKLMASTNAVSRCRGSTVQCFLCCVTVCQLFLI